MGKRYDVACDRMRDGTPLPRSWYVVDMRTVRQPNDYGVNVDGVAGPFRHIGQAFDVASRMNRPWPLRWLP